MAKSTSPPSQTSSHRKIRHDRSPERHHFYSRNNNQQQNHYHQQQQHRRRPSSPNRSCLSNDSRHRRPSPRYGHRDGSNRNFYQRSASASDLHLSTASFNISKGNQQHRKHVPSPSCPSPKPLRRRSPDLKRQRRSADEIEDPSNSSTSNSREEESPSVVSRLAGGNVCADIVSASGSRSVAGNDSRDLVSDVGVPFDLNSGAHQSIEDHAEEIRKKKQLSWQLACSLAHAYLCRNLPFDLNVSLPLTDEDVATKVPAPVSPVAPTPVQNFGEKEPNHDEVTAKKAVVDPHDVQHGVCSTVVDTDMANLNCTAKFDGGVPDLNLTTPNLALSLGSIQEMDEDVVCIDEVVNPTQAAEWFGIHFSCTAALVS